ncbi:hypothetical protein [Mesorhizobium sp. J8]|uniref:hypothetical protein n=1 Tax=Mesorhizobium sp. J8 TaxID=2777475 RepID=UPI001CD8BF6F|nr:hypothetical protein [Mesorhizobium sp. J8]
MQARSNGSDRAFLDDVTDDYVCEANKKRIAVDDREGNQPEGRKAGPDEAAGGSARSAMIRNLYLMKEGV